MTVAELGKFFELVSIRLYDVGKCTLQDDMDNRYQLTDRETMALACGFNCAAVIAELGEPKPVDEMTDDDITGYTHEFLKLLILVYKKAEELNSGIAKHAAK